MPLSFHLIVLLIFVLFPLYNHQFYGDWVAKVRREGEPARVAGYRETIIWWVIFALAVLAAWWSVGLSWADLGFRSWIGARTGIAWLLVAVNLAFLAGQLAKARRGAGLPPGMEHQLEAIDPLIPQTPRDHRWARIVAINAGITEEIVARAFLLWYLDAWMPLAAAAVVAAMLFAGLHAYQGWSNMPSMLAAAAVFVGIYLLGGSLWPVIVLHAAADILQLEALAQIRAREREVGNGRPSVQPA